MGKLASRPEFIQPSMVGAEFYLEAYSEIATSRPVGMGISPIPFDKIYLWCEIYDIQFSMLNLIVRAIDEKYLSYLSEKEKLESSKNGK